MHSPRRPAESSSGSQNTWRVSNMFEDTLNKPYWGRRDENVTVLLRLSMPVEKESKHKSGSKKGDEKHSQSEEAASAISSSAAAAATPAPASGSAASGRSGQLDLLSGVGATVGTKNTATPKAGASSPPAVAHPPDVFLRKIVVRAPGTNFSSPVGFGLVFLFDTLPEYFSSRPTDQMSAVESTIAPAESKESKTADRAQASAPLIAGRPVVAVGDRFAVASSLPAGASSAAVSSEVDSTSVNASASLQDPTAGFDFFTAPMYSQWLKKKRSSGNHPNMMQYESVVNLVTFVLFHLCCCV